jgi:hypothetical protein
MGIPRRSMNAVSTARRNDAGTPGNSTASAARAWAASCAGADCALRLAALSALGADGRRLGRGVRFKNPGTRPERWEVYDDSPAPFISRS